MTLPRGGDGHTTSWCFWGVGLSCERWSELQSTESSLSEHVQRKHEARFMKFHKSMLSNQRWLSRSSPEVSGMDYCLTDVTMLHSSDQKMSMTQLVWVFVTWSTLPAVKVADGCCLKSTSGHLFDTQAQACSIKLGTQEFFTSPHLFLRYFVLVTRYIADPVLHQLPIILF